MHQTIYVGFYLLLKTTHSLAFDISHFLIFTLTCGWMWVVFFYHLCFFFSSLSLSVLPFSQDAQIEREKQVYNITGGCTALTVVYLLGKLYVGNAGDSRCVHSCVSK